MQILLNASPPLCFLEQLWSFIFEPKPRGCPARGEGAVGLQNWRNEGKSCHLSKPQFPLQEMRVPVPNEQVLAGFVELALSGVSGPRWLLTKWKLFPRISFGVIIFQNPGHPEMLKRQASPRMGAVWPCKSKVLTLINCSSGPQPSVGLGVCSRLMATENLGTGRELWGWFAQVFSEGPLCAGPSSAGPHLIWPPFWPSEVTETPAKQWLTQIHTPPGWHLSPTSAWGWSRPQWLLKGCSAENWGALAMRLSLDSEDVSLEARDSEDLWHSELSWNSC